jgi:hypothetical protein
MYIICAIITIPVGILGFLVIPGTPDKPNTWVLKKSEVELAKARLHRAGHKTEGKVTLQTFVKLAKSPRVWALLLLDIFFWNGSANTSTGGYLLWLKSLWNLLHAVHLLRIRSRFRSSLGHHDCALLEHHRPHHLNRLACSGDGALVRIHDHLFCCGHVQCPLWLDQQPAQLLPGRTIRCTSPCKHHRAIDYCVDPTVGIQDCRSTKVYQGLSICARKRSVLDLVGSHYQLLR